MWFFFFHGQSWTNILRHILDYIRILARIRPKNRILTTPGEDRCSNVFFFCRTDGASVVNPAASGKTGLQVCGGRPSPMSSHRQNCSQTLLPVNVRLYKSIATPIYF